MLRVSPAASVDRVWTQFLAASLALYYSCNSAMLVRSYRNDVTLFFFDITCNSTRLSWSAIEVLFDSMSSEEFHRMLPLELSEDDDCVPGTRASSSVCCVLPHHHSENML